MAPKDHISEQVDKAIEFGDETLIRRLLMVVRKKSLESEEEKLKDALKSKGLYRPSIKEQIESIDPKRIEKIKARYLEGESIKNLAISYGLKAPLIKRLIDRSTIEDNFKLKNVNFNVTRKAPFTYESFYEASKKQINLRLNEESLNKLQEIYEYWKSKGNFKFLDEENPDAKIFNSNVSFSKFILETALNNLFVDMENEKQIDSLAEWIAEMRIKNKNIKSSWNKLKDSKIETWNLRMEELNEYINNLNKFEKENLYKKASKELTQINEEFYEIMWPIAISRSHALPDKKDETSQSNLKIARLKNLYGNQ